MANSGGNNETSQSPELHSNSVKDQLDQDQVSHVGDKRTTPEEGQNPSPSAHLGAVDGEQTPVIPPMSGPADLLGERDANGQGNESGSTGVGDELWDPRDELTPG